MQKIESKITAEEDARGVLRSTVVNWPQVIRYLMEDEDFGVQIKKEIPRTADLDAQLKNVKEIFHFKGNNRGVIFFEVIHYDAIAYTVLCTK